MSDSTKKPSLQDYLLVETGGVTGKVQLNALDDVLLPIMEGGPVEELEIEIDLLKEHLMQLSSNFAATHQTIDEINELYELQETTKAMETDPSILKEDRIKELIEDAELITIEEVDEAYDEEKEACDDNFEAANNKMTNWFY